jgi:rod shape-determining protein MreD
LLLAVLLEALVVPGVAPNGIRLDLVLVLIVAWGTLRGWESGLIAGLVGGFLVDLVSAAPFGVNVFRLGVIGLGTGLVTERVARTSALVPIAAAVVGSLLGFALMIIAFQAARWPIAWEYPFLLAVPNAVLTGVVMAIVFPFARLLDRATAGKAPEEVVP